jgi:hypothetical protein
VRSRAGQHRRTGPTVVALLLRGLVAAGLAADAVIHLRLAHGYELAAPAGIGEGTLFRIQAVAAIVAAVVVLLRAGRVVAAAGFVVAAAALAAVLLYRYFEVPAFGPVPSMYEPVWFPEKTLSAVTEAVAAIGALCLFLVTAHGRPSENRISTPLGAAGTDPDRDLLEEPRR